jgi:hypothetical protein
VSRLLIGNDFIEDVRDDRGWTGWWVQRIAWFAREGDVLVLPTEPDKDFFGYVAGLTGVDPGSWRVVVPPDHGAPRLLGPDRLADPELVSALEDVGDIDQIFALWPDMAVARLARSLGVEHALPGYGFVEQAGGVLVNSKSAFRTVAAGAGVSLPDGAVCTSRAELVRAAEELLETGEAVVAKHDWMSGGRGNEILSRASDAIRPIGARRVVPVSGRADIKAWADERWDWISDHGRGRPVIEHYVRDSSAYFTEFDVRDDGVEFRGDGELLSAPYAVGQVMPSQGLESEVRNEMIEGGRRLAVALQAMGYRGNLGPDAIVTPLREVMFTEWNGRVTGSTHIYGEIGATVVGPEFGSTRMILERVWPQGWAVTSFADAHERLQASGLGYDPERRQGVVFTNAFDGSNGVMYCIVAPSPDQAWAVDRDLAGVFGGGT